MSCKNGECIAKEKICDNEINCFDASDEICHHESSLNEYTKDSNINF